MIFMTVMAMRVKSGGLLLSSPCCKTWLWISRYTMGRHHAWFGDETRPDVAAANDTALFLAFLYNLLNDRNVYHVHEQPLRSSQPLCPGLAETFKSIGSERVVTWMGAFGCEIPKPTVLMSNLPQDADALMKAKKPPTDRLMNPAN